MGAAHVTDERTRDGVPERRIPGNVRRRAAVDDPELWKWFRADGRLERLPASPAARTRVLARVVERFEREREYEEREVNVLLSQVDNDFATLRRYLVDEGLLRREKARYRRT
jgi:hypothetical protein